MLRYFILIFVLCFYTLPIWSGSATSVFGSAQTQSDQDSTKTPASSVFGTSNIKSTSSTETSLEPSSQESSESPRSSSVFSRRTSSSASSENSTSGSRASSVFGGKARNRYRASKAEQATAQEDEAQREETQTSEQKTPENPRKAAKFLWPVDGGNVTSFFGWRSSSRFHDGIDIATPKGTKIFASKSGQVIYSSNKIRGYGNMIVIRHNEGYHTVYSHNNSNKVRKGDIVSQGDVIGLVGNTGHSSGPHLHFEIRKGKYSKDPLKFLGGVPASKGAYKNNDGAAIFSK